MKRYNVVLEISAECVDDARELLNDYTGMETDLCLKDISEIIEEDNERRLDKDEIEEFDKKVDNGDLYVNDEEYVSQGDMIRTYNDEEGNRYVENYKRVSVYKECVK